MSQPSEALGWRSVGDLVGRHPDARVALIGAPFLFALVQRLRREAL